MLREGLQLLKIIDIVGFPDIAGLGGCPDNLAFEKVRHIPNQLCNTVGCEEGRTFVSLRQAASRHISRQVLAPNTLISLGRRQILD